MNRLSIPGIFTPGILITLFPLILDAQKITFEGGISGTIHGADFVGEKEEFWGDDYEKSGIMAFSAGPFVRCNFTPETFGQMELKYSGKGSEFGYINSFFTQSFEGFRFRYIEVPVLIGQKGIFHSLSGDRSYHFFAGLVFSRMFQSTLGYRGPGRREYGASLNGFRKVDFSWMARVQMPYHTGKHTMIMLGLMMERSILSIHDRYKLYNFDYGLEICYIFRN